MASIATDRPNVVFILTDDHGYWAMGCAGNGEIRTPNLDRLEATGIHFENFFCASPVCSPARASLLTGRIPSQHGVHDWIRAGDTYDMKQEPEGKGRVIEYLAGMCGYTDVLAEHGYLCALSGKWHLGDVHHAQKGFTAWNVHAKGGGPYYNAPMVEGDRVVEAPGYVTDVITDNALSFLETQAQADERPFYLGVHYTAPHSPWQREHHPAALWDEYYTTCPFHSVPEGKAPPAWVERLSIPVKDAETRRTYLSGYYAAVTAMDANVGRLLDWLEANGLRENTLVFFTSDNGMSMGHHGIYGKGNGTFPLNMFDSALRVPALASRPGHLPHGIRNADLLSHYDVMPTLLEYLNLPIPDPDARPGRSFAEVFHGRHLSNRNHIVVMDEYGPVRMIRTPHWKYVHRYPYGPNELYDLKNDSCEQVNLVGLSECQERAAAMRHELQDWFLRYVDPAMDGTKEAVTGLGQLCLVGPRAKGGKSFV